MEQFITHNNISVSIQYADWTESPREWEPSSHFVLKARRYNFPNEIDFKFDDFHSWDEAREELEKDYKYVFSVFMYEHGDIAFNLSSFGDPWDSGQIGFICIDLRRMMAEYSATDWDAKAEEIATRELQQYEDYVRNNAYDAIITTPDGEEHYLNGYLGDINKSGLLDDIWSTVESESDSETADKINSLIEL